MSQPPTACPDPAHLRAVLDGSLPDADRPTVEAHLEICASCRRQLDEWTGESTVPARAPRTKDAAGTETRVVLGELLGRPHGPPGPSPRRGDDDPMEMRPLDGPPDHSGTDAGAGTRIIDGGVPLHFLGPTDRAGSLGRLGPYEVLERIGQGGMGLVLRAWDERLNRVVAVKLLLPALASDSLARRRFLREARAAAAVCHEHVVTIHAVDEVAGHPYLVMQLVAGQSLQQKLDRLGPLGLEEILRIGMQVAAALAAAHAQGLVHRDIKPANILLENGNERVKVTDFGLAKAVDDAGLTQSGVIAGTPSYMSPEQARGESIDRRTDLFSLGSVLYAMCTGRPPFRAQTTVAVLRKVSDEAPLPIRSLNSQVPEWLAAIVDQLMAKDPAHRYQTAAEVAEVLANHLAELQHPTRPAPALPATAVAPRTNAAGLFGIVALLVSLLALAVGLLVWWTLHSRDSVQVARVPADRPSVEAGPTAPPPPPDVKNAPGVVTKADPAARRQVDELIAAGDAALRSGHHARAIEHFSQAIRLDPTNLAPLLRRAGVYTRNEVENWPGAIADATAVLQRDGRNLRAYELRGYASNRSGEFRRAVADATEMLRLDPDHAEAYSIRGSAYTSLREWDQAIADLSKFLASNPKGAWPTLLRGQAYQGKGEDDHALVDFNRALELNPRINQFWITRGELRTRKRDVAGALADLSEAIRVSSTDLDKFASYAARANCERALSLIDPAIADYSELIRRDRKRVVSQDVWVLANRGGVSLARGDVDRALADLDEAIRLSPRSDWNYHHTRALAHARKGQFDQSLADIETARNIPGLEKTLAVKGLMARGDYLVLAGRIEHAEAAYAESVQLDPTCAYGVLVSRAWLVDRPRGDYDAALSKLNEVARGGMIYQFLYRGLISSRIGRPDQALADFEEVMKRAKVRGDWFAVPDYLCRWLALLIGRGEAYLLKGDLERALVESDEAVRFAPWSAEARLLRADVHAKRGKADLAAADRREAQRLTPDPMFARPEPRSANSGHRSSVP